MPASTSQTTVPKNRRAVQVAPAEAVRIRSEIASMARKICGLRECSITDYLSEILEPVIKSDLEKERQKLILSGPVN